MKFGISVLSIVAVAGFGVSAASATSTYTAVVVPPVPGGTQTIGYGVNDAGWVVGKSDSPSGIVGFVFHDGVTQPLPLLPGGSEAQASSINAALTIVGECRNADGILRPVKWTRSVEDGVWEITDLGTFMADNSGFGVATRINNAGQIVGYATSASGPSYHGFLLTGAVRTDVGTLGFSGSLAYSQALGVSESGLVSGYAYRVLGGPEHGLAYFTDRGTDVTPQERFGLAQWHGVTDNQVLGGYISGNLTGGAFRPATWEAHAGFTLAPLIDGLPEGYGYDINNNGSLVGTMFLLDPDPSLSVFRAFLFENGATVDLSANTPNLPGPLTEARDISNTGYIVATSDSGFGTSAVLLMPGTSCAPDFNRDGALDPDDLADYISAFFSAPPLDGADYNADGNVDPDDLADFIGAFFAGC